MTRTKLIKLFATAVMAMGLSGFAQAQSLGTGGLSMNSNDPIQVEGNRLELFEQEGRAVFDGNVTVVQGDTVLRTGKLIIFYDTSGGTAQIGTGEANIDRLEVSGGVNIQTGEQIATGEAGFYDMKRDLLVLTGKRVTLSEGGNVATGCKLTVTMSTNQARLEGCASSNTRPTILIQPRSVRQ